MNNFVKITPDLNINFRDLMRQVDISEEFTLMDLLRASACSTEIPIEIMEELLQCSNIESYYEEANSRPFESNGNIDYLELYWSGYTDCYAKGHKKECSSMWAFHGIGKLGEIPNDCPERYDGLTEIERATFRENYAIELSPLYNLSGFQIKISPKMTIMDYEIHDYEKCINDIPFQPSITLIELLYWVFWELSFFGSPEDRDSTKDDLVERVDEIKEAKENGTLDEITKPWEDVKKEIEEKLRRNFIKENPPMDVPQEKSKNSLT